MLMRWCGLEDSEGRGGSPDNLYLNRETLAQI